MAALFTERQRRILSYLKQHATSISELATHYAVSERSIRNDISCIKEWCETYEVQLTVKKSIIALNENDVQKLQVLLNAYDLDDASVTPLTRQLHMTLMLLMSEEPLHLHDFAAQFQISKTTASTDMKAVAQWLRKQCIELQSEYAGYAVVCTELQRRVCMITALQWLEENYGSSSPYKKVHWAHLSHKDLQQFEALYKQQARVAHDDFPLYESLLVQLERVKGGAMIEPLHGPLPTHAVQHFAQQLVSAFGYALYHDELAYVQLMYELYSQSYYEQVPLRIAAQNDRMISNMCDQLGIKQVNADTKYFLHVELARLEKWQSWQLYRYNPIYPKLAETYKVMIQLLDNLRQQTALYAHTPINTWAEIILLIASEFEQQDIFMTRLQAILVCPTGSATSHFLMKRLTHHIPNLCLVQTVSLDVFEEARSALQYDFIISTVMLKTSDEKVMVIPPFFDERQLAQLQQFVQQLEKEKQEQQASLASLIPHETTRVTKRVACMEELLQHGVSMLAHNNIVEPTIIHSFISAYEKFGLYYEILPGIIMPHIMSPLAKTVGISCVMLEEPLRIDDKEIYAAIYLVTPNELAHIQTLKRLYEYLSKIENAAQFCADVREGRELYDR